MNCKECPYIRNELEKLLADCLTNIAYNNSTKDIYENTLCQYCFCEKLDSRLVACEERCDTIYFDAIESRTHSKKYKNHTKNKNTKANSKDSRANSKDSRANSKKKRGNKRRQYLRYQRHLEQLWKIVHYPYPVLYVDYIWIKGKLCDRKVPYYRKEPDNHGGIGRRFCKKMSNRRVRHYKGGISKGGNYRKYLIISGASIKL